MYPNATKKLLSETFPTSVLYWPDYIVPTSDCHIVSSPCFYIVSTLYRHIVSTPCFYVVSMSYCYIVSTSYFYIVTTSDCHIVFLFFFIKKTPFKPPFFSQFSPFCLYIQPSNIQIHFYFITNIRALTGFEPLHIFFRWIMSRSPYRFGHGGYATAM